LFSVDTVYVLTINGTLIASAPMTSEATAVTTWRDSSGVDFVVFANAKFSIFKFDSLDLEKKTIVTNHYQQIIDLQYIKQFNAIAWCNISGQLFLQPM
jgi:folate-dependent tRNA-U54 methylase TrmFO/GidA